MRIAVSGTYSTGKTTTTLALSYLTGIKKTHARTIREILPTTFPGKRLEMCKPHELIELAQRRFYERCTAEEEMGGNFLSDGCSLQEWVYSSARLVTGLNPNEPRWKVKMEKMLYKYRYDVFALQIENLGKLVKSYATKHYDLFIHLPVEFPFVADGHRPVKEEFRYYSEEILLKTYKEINANVMEVRGSMEERLETLVTKLNLNKVMSIDEAVAKASVNAKVQFDDVKMEYEV